MRDITTSGDLSDHADSETSKNIDEEGRERKCNRGKEGFAETRDEKARESAERATAGHNGDFG